MCFVCIHLQPHEGDKYFEIRNDDFKYIAECFYLKNSISTSLMINNDFIWIFGDFNYRFNGISRHLILDNINQNNIQFLLGFDELTKSLHALNALRLFDESLITFKPTYKFQVDNNFQNDSMIKKFSKKRIPAYCDRIIYKHNKEYELEPISYLSIPELIGSDHEPVCGIFKVKIPKSVNNNKKNVEVVDFGKIRLVFINRFIQFTILPLLWFLLMLITIWYVYRFLIDVYQ